MLHTTHHSRILLFHTTFNIFSYTSRASGHDTPKQTSYIRTLWGNKHACIHGVGQASDASFFSTQISFVYLRRILFASQRHASLCRTKLPSLRTVLLLILFPPLSQNTARMGEYGDGLDTTFSSSPHSAGLAFFSFVAEFFFWSPFFLFGSGYICITDTPRVREFW